MRKFSAVEDVEGALHRIGALKPRQAVVQVFDRLCAVLVAAKNPQKRRYKTEHAYALVNRQCCVRIIQTLGVAAYA
jgi:hypothetical protein